MTNYDFAIIGAGAAGSSCVELLNQNGYRVALIEKDALGGTCLNYGCDPTKTLLRIAEVLHQARQGSQYGLNVPSATPASQRDCTVEVPIFW